MRYLLLFSLYWFILVGCSSTGDPGTKKAQEIVDKAIAVHGNEKFNNLNLAFNFRDRHYTAKRKDGLFTYTRSFTDSTGRVEDILTNNSFNRKVNGKLVNLPKEREQAFSQSVNSVIYFALLPFGLNDAAVQKKYIGETTIQNQSYHKIEVTFDQEGGGTDYEDTYIYWIHPKNFTLDYLAYSFHTDGGGLRFRKSYNSRLIGGIRFQDYINYEPATKSTTLIDLDKNFAAGQLKELSRIELKNIQIK